MNKKINTSKRQHMYFSLGTKLQWQVIYGDNACPEQWNKYEEDLILSVPDASLYNPHVKCMS